MKITIKYIYKYELSIFLKKFKNAIKIEQEYCIIHLAQESENLKNK